MKGLKAVFLALVLQMCVATPALADAVARCDGCSHETYRSVAEAYGEGYTYIIDFTNARLTLWETRYDPEMVGTIVEQLPIDPAIEGSFLFLLDEKATGKADIHVTITPGEPTGPLFTGDVFGGFGNSNAHEVIGSATVRTNLGSRLAESISGQTPSTRLNNLLVTVTSVLLGVDAPGIGGPNTIVITINWKDGTKTVYKITSGNVTRAEYQQGESEDSDGNIIPDGSFVSDAGHEYAGDYAFTSDSNLNKWLLAAHLYGIEVTGSPSGSRRLKCEWDGVREIKCRYLAIGY